jgi:hypothetical protein
MMIQANLPGGRGIGFFFIEDDKLFTSLKFAPSVIMSSTIAAWIAEQEDEEFTRKTLLKLYKPTPDFVLAKAGRKGRYRLFPVSKRAVTASQ